MAMNGTTLGTAIKNAVVAAISSNWTNIPDSHKLTGRSLVDYWTLVGNAIGTSVVAHIQANAKCIGADSHGDTHDSVGIV